MRTQTETQLELALAELFANRAEEMPLWLSLRQDDVCAIPKAAIAEHVRENRRALELELDSEDVKLIDEAFPAPTRPEPLEVI